VGYERLTSTVFREH
ncbi:Partner of Paired, partial [Danaus plexippus plexippus]